MTATAIEWADRVWNPVTGCTKVSQGCKYCYAEVMAERFFARLYPPVLTNPLPDQVRGFYEERNNGAFADAIDAAAGTRPRRFTDVQCHPDRLDAPLRWRKPSRIFVNSMSDLFHEDVPDAFIAAVFGIMASSTQHTFLILTKRPERARSWFAMLANTAAMVTDGDGEVRWCIKHLDQHITRSFHCVLPSWPLPNVWLGVSVEDQATADQRIPILLQTPAAVRWVSYEPALGSVNFCPWIHADWSPTLNWWKYSPVKTGPVIDWIVCGGESGPKARPCRPHWIRQVVEPCRVSQSTRVFVKQLGSRVITRNDDGWEGDTQRSWPMDTRYDENIRGHRDDFQGADVRVRLRDRKGGDPSEWPEDLRVRQFPEVRA